MENILTYTGMISLKTLVCYSKNIGMLLLTH